jgi:hypothetical protein
VANTGRIIVLERLVLGLGTVNLGASFPQFIGLSIANQWNFNNTFSWFEAFQMGGTLNYTVSPFFGASAFLLRAIATVKSSANVSLGAVPVFINQLIYHHDNFVFNMRGELYAGFTDLPNFTTFGTGSFTASNGGYDSFRARAEFNEDFPEYNGFRFGPELKAGHVPTVNAFNCDDYGFAAGVDPDPSIHVRRSYYSPGPNMSMHQEGPSLLKVPIHGREWVVQSHWDPAVAVAGVIGDFDLFGIAGGRFAIVSNANLTVVNGFDQWVRYTTANVLNNDAYIQSTTFDMVQPVRLLSFTASIQFEAILTDIRVWVGLFSATPVGSGTPAITYAAFRYDTGIDGTAFWRCVSDTNTGAPTVTTTVVPITSINTPYRLSVVLDSATSARFYINGLLVATHTALIPGTGQPLGVHVGVRTLAAVIKHIMISKLSMQQSLV